MKIKGTPNRKLEQFSTYSKVLYVEYSRKKNQELHDLMKDPECSHEKINTLNNNKNC